MPLIDLNPVPKSVTPLQARRALRQAGLATFVQDLVATMDEETQEAWAYALEIRRDDAALSAAAAEMGMSDSDLDELFRLAATM